MTAVGRLGEQAGENRARVLDGRHRLQRGCDVERTFARAPVDDVGPACQQQDGENVFRPLSAAHDVLADRTRAELVPCVADRLEHGQCAPAHCIQVARRTLIAREQLAQLFEALLGRQAGPIGRTDALADDLVVHMGVLRDIERGEMEAERADAAHETAHEKISGMAAAVQDQARCGELEVGEQLVRTEVAVRTRFVSGLEPLAELAEEDPVRHSVVTRGRKHLDARQHGRISLDALGERGTDTDAMRALRKAFGEMAAFFVVARDDDLPVPLQRLADRLAMHVVITVHVAADPRPEAQDVGQIQRLARHPERHGECGLDLFVEMRHDAVQNVDQIEQHVLAFVGDGQVLARMLLRLPDGRDLEPHARPERLHFARRERRIQAVEQILGDALLLAQDRAARRFGWMRREHRLDAHGGDEVHDLPERQAVAPQAGDAISDAAGLARSGVVEVLAATPDAMDLLGRIDGLEPDRKSPDQVGRGAGRSAGDAPLEIDGRGVAALAPFDRGPAVTLDEQEEFLAALLAQHLADRVAEGVHVFAQRAVLDRELNALSKHEGPVDCQNRYYELVRAVRTMGARPGARPAAGRSTRAGS